MPNMWKISPAFLQGISGMELGEKMHDQAVKHGLQTTFAEVTGLKIQGTLKTVKTTEGNFMGRTVILAGGAIRKKLGVTGETRLMGKGVSYCAVCDGAFFQNQTVAVVGGGDTAITEALHLTKFASKVIVIHRRDQLRATEVLREKALSEPKIEFIWNSTVAEIEGDETVERIKLLNVKTGECSTTAATGILFQSERFLTRIM